MRPLRLKLAQDGARYHIMTRTAQQALLFDEDEVKEWIYKQIVWLAKIYQVTLNSVAVLGNHYHIILTVWKPERDDPDLVKRWEMAEAVKSRPKKWKDWEAEEWHRRLADLSEYAKELNQSVATYVNRRTGKHGHVWGDRFKSVIIEDGKGTLAAMSYCEMNPVRAGLCKSPLEYRWCSVGRYEQGGAEASGVTVPKMQGFAVLPSEKQRQKAFSLFVEHLAQRYAGKDSHFPCEIAELEKVVDECDIEEILSLVVRRTRWITDSLILGGKAFCQEIIARFNLQPSKGKEGQPFSLQSGLYNSRQRAGP